MAGCGRCLRLSFERKWMNLEAGRDHRAEENAVSILPSAPLTTDATVARHCPTEQPHQSGHAQVQVDELKPLRVLVYFRFTVL
jgi:hypothetical protein